MVYSISTGTVHAGLTAEPEVEIRGGRVFAKEIVWGCWVELQDRGRQCEFRPEERFSYFGLTGVYPKSVLTILMSEVPVFLTRITHPQSDRRSVQNPWGEAHHCKQTARGQDNEAHLPRDDIRQKTYFTMNKTVRPHQI